MSDRLPDVEAELEELGNRPLEEHPDVLERLHATLVDELDRTG